MAKTKGWLPVFTGAVTLLLAVWVAFTFITPEPGTSPAPQAAEEVPVATIVTTTTSSAPVVITTPPPEIDGVSESIARVLASNGFASEMSAADIADQIPGSVLRTLIANRVVLSIATEGE